MCFYEQYVYQCRDWKWGIFRQHCQAEYRTGEPCGMKMVYQVTGLEGKCKLCIKIEAKARRRSKQIDDYNRWRKHPERYQASIENALNNIRALEDEINQLECQKHDRDGAMFGNSSRSLMDSPLSRAVSSRSRPGSHTTSPEAKDIVAEHVDTDSSKTSLTPITSQHCDSTIEEKGRARLPELATETTRTPHHHGMVEQIMEAFFIAQEVMALLASALEDPDVNIRQLRRTITHSIEFLRLHIVAETTSLAQLDVAKTLGEEGVMLHAAELVIRRLYKREFGWGRREKPTTTTTRDATDMHSLLSDSGALYVLELNLLIDINKTYGKRVLLALGGDLVGPQGCHLEPNEIACVAKEISWVPPHIITSSKDVGGSYSDGIKTCVEQFMGETWNWWPLAPRLQRLRPGYYRVEWKSPCDMPRHVDIPEHTKTALYEALGTAPSFVNIDLPSTTRTLSPYGSNNSKPANSPTATQSRSTAMSTSNPTATRTPIQSQRTSVPDPAPNPNFYTATPNQPTSRVREHLSLCVVGSARQFISLKCDNLRSDLEFFAKLKAEYDRARGWLRLWFSMWQYKYSEFVLFHKYGYKRGARVDVGYPEHDDQMYHFRPRKPIAPPPRGPISKEQFQDHYYLDHCPSLYDWRRYQLSYRGHFNAVKRVALDAVPKRVVQINMDDGVDEHFFGLYAKEERSFIRVAIYAALCNVPGIVFFFLWLFQWGHGSDLQNASVPLTLSLSLTLGFAAVVFGTRENR